MTDGVLYMDGKKIDLKTEAVELNATVKPIGDLHSVPHFRCGVCHCAVVLYQNDERPEKCRWCGCCIDWKDFEKEEG